MFGNLSCGVSGGCTFFLWPFSLSVLFHLLCPLLYVAFGSPCRHPWGHHRLLVAYFEILLHRSSHSREVTVALEFRCRSVLSGSGALATSTCSLISRLNLSNFVVAFSVAEDKVHDLDQHCGLSMCTLAPYRDVRDAKLLAAPNPFWSEASRTVFSLSSCCQQSHDVVSVGILHVFGLSVAISYPRSTSARSPSRCILLRSR